MGRIDEALRRASTDARTPLPAPASQDAQGDVFTSPWSFNDDAAPHAAPAAGALPPTEPAVEETGHISGNRLAVFRGFNPELTGRIVSSPGAPPFLSEQFRRLAATLHHAQLVQGTRTVMITSANAGDGKSLTATNLALTLSESYRRQVLLIDADLRRPSLHEIFRVPNVAGLNDGLKSGRDARLAVLKISETLTLLPAGRPDPDPMSSLTSPRMGKVLNEAASRFDWVIVDTAPLGLLADANLLSTMMDCALLVIRARQTPHAMIQRALDSLGRDRVLGVVLNAVQGESLHSEYYGRYTPDPQSTQSTAIAKAD